MESQARGIEPQSGKFPQALIWIAGIALTLFCGAGIGALMGWIPNAMDGPGDRAAMDQRMKNTVPYALSVTLSATAAHRAAVARAAPAKPAAAASCAECGVIESVREVKSKGNSSGIGAAGGAVAGRLAGNQAGADRGRKAMTVPRAVAGNEVEKKVATTTSYVVTVRLNDGSSRMISEAGLPAWHTGDKVKLVDGAIQSNA